MIEWYEIKDDHQDSQSNETKGRIKFPDKAKRKLRDFGCWIDRNKETIVILAPVVFAGLGGVAKLATSANKKINLKKEKDLKELYCYDPSLGHYWQLKRKLTNSEWVKIDKRKSNGERLADILNEMKVLK